MDTAGKAIADMTREELLFALGAQEDAIASAKLLLHIEGDFGKRDVYSRFLAECQATQHRIVERLALVERRAVA